MPLESAESVFTTVLGTLGSCLSRVPDSETGERRRRDDPACVALLAGLAVPGPTRLYFGLLCYDDEAGDRRPIDTARGVASSSGVATERGWGRDDPGCVESHRQAVAHLTNGLPSRRVSC